MNCPTCGKPVTSLDTRKYEKTGKILYQHYMGEHLGFYTHIKYYARPSPADLFRIFRQTWGDQSPDDIRARMLLDPLLLDERQKG